MKRLDQALPRGIRAPADLPNPANHEERVPVLGARSSRLLHKQ